MTGSITYTAECWLVYTVALASQAQTELLAPYTCVSTLNIYVGSLLTWYHCRLTCRESMAQCIVLVMTVTINRELPSSRKLSDAPIRFSAPRKQRRRFCRQVGTHRVSRRSPTTSRVRFSVRAEGKTVQLLRFCRRVGLSSRVRFGDGAASNAIQLLRIRRRVGLRPCRGIVHI